MPKLAKRFDTLPEYVLAKIPQQKAELLKRGVDVIDLGAGDADLMPPEAAVRRLTEAVQIPGMNRYGFGLGLMKFREAASAWMDKRFGVKFGIAASQIEAVEVRRKRIIVHGGKGKEFGACGFQ